MSTEPTSDIVTTPGPAQPLWAIQPTTEAVVTPSYEVFAANDPRGGPTSVGIVAIDSAGVASDEFLSSSIELKGPDDIWIRLIPVIGPDFLNIAFASHFRINKPETDTPMGYVLFGYGASNSASS